MLSAITLSSLPIALALALSAQPVHATPTVSTRTVDVAATTALSGSRSIGPVGCDYPSLTSAFADLALNGVDGPLVLELDPAYTSASETFPLTAGTWPGSGPVNTVTVRPRSDATALAIASGNTTGTFDLNGAQYLILDGRPGGVGAIRALTIENTTTSGWALRFVNDARSNSVRHAVIRGAASSAAAGVVVFAGTTGSFGNDDNTIESCDVRDGVVTPTNCIYSAGSTATPQAANSGNRILNCNIFNFFEPTTGMNGILLMEGTDAWTISGNSFYQTATRNVPIPGSAAMSALQIVNPTSNPFTIEGNFIGGTAPLAAGTPMTLTGRIAIRMFWLSVGRTAPTSIQGNTFANIAVTTNSFTSQNSFIAMLDGTANIGTITGNTIGSQSVPASITFAGEVGGAPGTGSVLSGIYVSPNGLAYLGSAVIANNTIGGIAISGIGIGNTAGYGIVYAVRDSSSITVTGNTIGSPTTANSFTNSTAHVLIGIQGIGASRGSTISNNLVANLANLGTSTASTCVGIRVNDAGGYVGVHEVSGNIVRHCTSASTTTATNYDAAISGIALGRAFTLPGHSIVGNEVYGLRATAPSGAVVVQGIYYEGVLFGPNTIARNWVRDLSAESTSPTAAIYGIQAGPGAVTIENNFVRLGYSSTGSPLTAGHEIRGIFTGTTTLGSLQHNTVLVGGAGVSGTAPTYALFDGASVTTRSYLDNLFVNARSNGSGSGKHYALRLTGAQGLASDYNGFHVSGVGGVFGSSATTDHPTLEAWRSAYGLERQSFFADPGFLSPGGDSASVNLHLGAGPSPAEAAGTPIPSVTLDFDGEVRADRSPVDIGADAANLTPLDRTPPIVAYSALLPGVPGIRTLVATVSDAGSGVPSSGVALPVLYWRINAGAFTPVTGTPLGAGQFQFQLGGGAVAGDTVAYYVVAQDAASPPNVGIDLLVGTSGLTANPPAAATPPTLMSRFNVLATITGTFTVGSGGDYPTLTAATADANAKFWNGPVTFLLISPTYTSPAETFPITILANPGASAANSLTIRPSSGVTATVTGSGSKAVLLLDGADHVIVDGSNNGTTSRDLTFRNTSTSPFSAVVWLQASGDTNAVTHCRLQHLVVTGNGNTQTSVGIGSGGESVLPTSGVGGNSHNVVRNCVVSRTQYGLSAQSWLTPRGVGNVFEDNLVNVVSPDNVARGGIVLGFQDSAVVTRNKVGGMSMSATVGAVGIGAGLHSFTTTAFNGAELTNATITNNLIGPVSHTNAAFSSAGILLAAAASGTNRIANNMVQGVTGVGITAGIAAGGGIGSVTQVHGNSVSMTGRFGGTQPHFALALIGPSSTTDVRNNVLVNAESSGVAKKYAIGLGWAGTVGGYADLISDHNALYSAGSANSRLGVTGGIATGTDRATLVDWYTETGRDFPSVSVNVLPPFVSATDLHLQPGATTALESGGTPLATLAVDFDGEVRHPATPDIGADEGAFVRPNGNDITVVSLDDPVSGSFKLGPATFSPKATFADSGTANQSNITVRYRILGPAPDTTEVYNQTFVIPSLLTLGSIQVTFPQITLAVQGLYTTIARAELAGDDRPANDQRIGTFDVFNPLCGTYAVGASQPAPFNTLTAALTRLSLAGAGCAVVFELADLTYGPAETLPIVIPAFPGASAANTLTIRPAPGATVAITGSVSGAVIKWNGADHVTIDGSNAGTSSRDLTISNTSTAPNTAVVWLSSLGAGAGCTFNVIRNCNLSSGANQGVQSIQNFGVVASGTTLSNTADGLDNDHNRIADNAITGSRYGISMRGGAANPNDRNRIEGNIVGPAAFGAGQIGKVGIHVMNQDTCVITRNEVRFAGLLFAQTAVTDDRFGIALGSEEWPPGSGVVANTMVTRNHIHDIVDEKAASAVGILLAGAKSGAPTNNVVANNMIHDLRQRHEHESNGRDRDRGGQRRCRGLQLDRPERGPGPWRGGVRYPERGGYPHLLHHAHEPDAQEQRGLDGREFEHGHTPAPCDRGAHQRLCVGRRRRQSQRLPRESAQCAGAPWWRRHDGALCAGRGPHDVAGTVHARPGCSIAGGGAALRIADEPASGHRIALAAAGECVAPGERDG